MKTRPDGFETAVRWIAIRNRSLYTGDPVWREGEELCATDGHIYLRRELAGYEHLQKLSRGLATPAEPQAGIDRDALTWTPLPALQECRIDVHVRDERDPDAALVEITLREPWPVVSRDLYLTVAMLPNVEVAYPSEPDGAIGLRFKGGYGWLMPIRHEEPE